MYGQAPDELETLIWPVPSPRNKHNWLRQRQW